MKTQITTYTLPTTEPVHYLSVKAAGSLLEIAELEEKIREALKELETEGEKEE